MWHSASSCGAPHQLGGLPTALDHCLTPTGERYYSWRVIRAFALIVALGFASGCAGAMQPTYTQAELAKRCQQTGGWWHADDLLGGNCEYETGFQ